jgi:hypothetical protein
MTRFFVHFSPGTIAGVSIIEIEKSTHWKKQKKRGMMSSAVAMYNNPAGSSDTCLSVC